MRHLILALTVLLIGTAEAKTQKYWTCTDAAGRKSAQDFPCPEPMAAQPTQVPAQPLAEVPEPLPPSSHPQASAKPLAKPPQVDYFGIMIKPLIPLFGLFALALLAIFAFKMWLAKKASNMPKHGSYTSTKLHEYVEPSDELFKATFPQRTEQPQLPNPTEWSLELIRVLEWKRFEDLCEGLWKAKGYLAEQTTLGADGGVDVVIKDRANPNTIFAVIQCKAWGTKQVGVETVRALWGAKDHFKAKLAIFYGLSGFTEDAKAWASEKYLKLISGEELLAQILTLSAEQQKALLVQLTQGDYTTPSCPKCGRKMVYNKGRNKKGDFWGCPNFRQCNSPIISVRA